MPVSMNTLINEFSTLGKDHVGVNTNDQGNTEGLRRASDGGFDRFVNWLKGGSTQKTENRAALNFVKSQVAENLGDQYAAAFQTRMQKSFDSIRPISGMKIAAALREVTELKNTEQQARLEIAKINNKALIQHSMPEIQEALENTATQYGILPEHVDMQSITDKIQNSLDITSERTLKGVDPGTPEGLAKLQDSIQFHVRVEVEETVKQSYNNAITNHDPSMQAMLKGALIGNGIAGEPSDRLLQALCKKASSMAYNNIKQDGNIVPAKPADIQASMTQAIGRVIQTLNAVNDTALPPAGKQALKGAILHTDSLINVPVMQMVADTLSANDNLTKLGSLFTASKNSSHIPSVKQDLMAMQMDFHNARVTQGNAVGGDDIGTAAVVIMETLAHLAREDGKINFSTHGELFVRTSHDLKLHYDNIVNSGQDPQAGVNGQVGFAKHLLATFDAIEGTEVGDFIQKQEGLPATMIHKDDLAAIEQANNKPSSFQSFFSLPGNAERKDAIRADILTNMAQQPNGSFNTFKVDFARQFGLKVNGQALTNTTQATQDNLAHVLAAFNGNQNIMEKVLAFAHQGNMADLTITALNTMPELMALSMSQEPLISQSMKTNIDANADGSYTIHFSGFMQKGDIGLSAVSDIRVSNFDNNPPTVELLDFDYCLQEAK